MTLSTTVTIQGPHQNFSLGQKKPLVFMLGPCVIESRQHALAMASSLKDMATSLNISFIYKSSFDKANRTSPHGYRGVGLEEGLDILAEVREKIHVPVMTDVHTAEQCDKVGACVDLLQIPAFLCRQTDLLQAAALTKKPLNIKKGQFLAPWDMKNVVDKMRVFGCEDVMLCERGVSFGYNTLVSDMRALAIMADMGKPVVFDATHSVQQPGGAGDKSGGQREFVPLLARAAVAVGVAGVFMEVHDTPENAPSDGPNMLRLSELKNVLSQLIALDRLVKNDDFGTKGF